MTATVLVAGLQLSEAEEVLGRLSILEPTNFDHKERMGDLKIRMAGEGTRRAMEIRYDLGTILEEQGKVDEARAQYTQVYERDINFRDIKVRLESLQKKSS